MCKIVTFFEKFVEAFRILSLTSRLKIADKPPQLLLRYARNPPCAEGFGVDILHSKNVLRAVRRSKIHKNSKNFVILSVAKYLKIQNSVPKKSKKIHKFPDFLRIFKKIHTFFAKNSCKSQIFSVFSSLFSKFL